MIKDTELKCYFDVLLDNYMLDIKKRKFDVLGHRAKLENFRC